MSGARRPGTIPARRERRRRRRGTDARRRVMPVEPVVGRKIDLDRGRCNSPRRSTTVSSRRDKDDRARSVGAHCPNRRAHVRLRRRSRPPQASRRLPEPSSPPLYRDGAKRAGDDVPGPRRYRRRTPARGRHCCCALSRRVSRRCDSSQRRTWFTRALRASPSSEAGPPGGVMKSRSRTTVRSKRAAISTCGARVTSSAHALNAVVRLAKFTRVRKRLRCLACRRRTRPVRRREQCRDRAEMALLRGLRDTGAPVNILPASRGAPGEFANRAPFVLLRGRSIGAPVALLIGPGG